MTDLELADHLARAAGEVLLEHAAGPARGVESKSSPTDMVSAADHAAEELIVGLLTRYRPEDGLLAEEGSRSTAATGRRWVVDPLDGTTNFLYGQPTWCVSVALEDGEGLLAGVVHQPSSGETFRAERGHGASLDGQAIHVRDHSELATALVATGFGYDAERRDRQADALTGVLPRVRDIRRGGSAALDLSWVAAGRLDGYYERGVNRWDYAAGALLVREAGGVVRELPGEPFGLVACGPALAEPLLEVASRWPA